MSLAGAQHKLAVVLQDGALFEAAGATPSTHILKPDHPDTDYHHSAINEWFVMRLAKRLGIDVPDVHRRYVPSPVYLIDRFDRVFVGNHDWGSTLPQNHSVHDHQRHGEAAWLRHGVKQGQSIDVVDQNFIIRPNPF
jgi:hypothetical protein